MISNNEALRKISDVVYQEANPPNDRNRPLEWRRHFNFIRLPLKNIKIISDFKVSNSNWDIDNKHATSPWHLIKPEINTTRSISGLVDNEKTRDTIYCTLVDGDNKEISKLEKPSGNTKVVLKTGKPIEGNESFPNGIYHGICFRADFEPGEDYLCFELQLPEKQIEDILKHLAQNPNTQIEVGVNLLSFSYEVDDFLSEWYHPRDLFIEKGAAAPVAWVNISTSLGIKMEISRENLEDNGNIYADEPHNQITPSTINIIAVTKALKGLTVAIWILVLVVGYSLIK